MNTDAVFNAAQTAAIQLIESGNFIPPDSTVCAVETASGRIFTGISRNELNGHVSVPVHAETEAVKNMLASGERVITALLLINTQNRAPMLPCNNCIGYILSLDPRNGECLIIMPDRMIKLSEAVMFSAQTNTQNPAQPQMYRGSYHAGSAQPLIPPVQPQAPVGASEDMSGGAMLKNKVNSLLGVADEDEDTEETETEKKKPKRGLFGRFRK